MRIASLARAPRLAAHVHVLPAQVAARTMASQKSGRTALEEMDTKGAFVRKDAVHRHWIKKGSRFEPEGALRFDDVVTRER